MRYAQIQNDKVVNVIELSEGASEWQGLLVIPSDTANIGDDFINGKIVKPSTPEHIPTQEEINEEARAYLSLTDWYVVRFAETGVAIPQEILDARQAARERIV